jgi:hypothetical protein
MDYSTIVAIIVVMTVVKHLKLGDDTVGKLPFRPEQRDQALRKYTAVFSKQHVAGFGRNNPRLCVLKQDPVARRTIQNLLKKRTWPLAVRPVSSVPKNPFVFPLKSQ